MGVGVGTGDVEAAGMRLADGAEVLEADAPEVLEADACDVAEGGGAPEVLGVRLADGGGALRDAESETVGVAEGMGERDREAAEELEGAEEREAEAGGVRVGEAEGADMHWLLPLQVWPPVQEPHCPPHPSEPHCLPAQSGVHADCWKPVPVMVRVKLISPRAVPTLLTMMR